MSTCVCTDCAEAYKVIAPYSPGHTEHGYLNSDGCLCEEDHDHDDCEMSWTCDDCGDAHTSETEAAECCDGYTCNECGATHTEGYWSSAAEMATSCCAIECSDCYEMYWSSIGHDCEGEEGHGESRVAPWEARGIPTPIDAAIASSDWQEEWGISPKNHNVVQAAADYYLLEAMKAGLVGTTDGHGNVSRDISSHTSMQVMRNEAEEIFDALVAEWDPILQAYTHMACGGELRHHNAIGGSVLSSEDRDSSWSGWKLIYEAVGPDALQDAATLFLEFSGGSFGGEPWANACKILHARVTGKIGPAMFLDRIFNHQHNGGNFLNKVKWAGDVRDSRGDKLMSLSDMTVDLLPAHGREPEPDYPKLLAYASPMVRRLFAETWAVARRVVHEIGRSVTDHPARPLPGITKQQQAAALAEAEAKKQAEWEAKLPSEKLEYTLKEYESYLEDYKAQAEMANQAQIGHALALLFGQETGLHGWHFEHNYDNSYWHQQIASTLNTIEYYKDKIHKAKLKEEVDVYA